MECFIQAQEASHVFDGRDMFSLCVGEGILPVGADLQKSSLFPDPAPYVSALGEDDGFSWIDTEVGQPEFVEYLQVVVYRFLVCLTSDD